jgi:S1-C subfamily serine protease
MRPAIFALALAVLMQPPLAVHSQPPLAAELPADSAMPNYSVEIPDLGTTDQYLDGSYGDGVKASEIEVLGITATNGVAQLKNGPSVRGVKVCSATPRGPGAIVGLRSKQVAASALLTAGFLAAAVLFPPAVLGAVAVETLNIGQSYDLILAVDGQRTHNLNELRGALTGTATGQLSYLVVLRGGQRKNLVVTLR